MLRKIMHAAAVITVALTQMALADGHAANSWTLDAGASKLAFGSVKKGTVGEVHSFEVISGSVAENGAVAIGIDLTSVQTNIDIRNERFGEHVFKGAAEARLTAQVDIAELTAMQVGATTVTDVEAVLSFLGAKIDIETELFVVRVSDTQVMITTNDMLFVGTEDLGISAGVDKLMELAKLPGITRTVPITARLMFRLDMQKAETVPDGATPVAVAVAGDVAAGKKVFRKCKACHMLKEGSHRAGPSLYNIVGARTGTTEGFGYSEAMSEAGLTWDTTTLSAFLANPETVVPGTSMSFNGLKKDKDVANVIAYIMAESGE